MHLENCGSIELNGPTLEKNYILITVLQFGQIEKHFTLDPSKFAKSYFFTKSAKGAYISKFVAQI